MSDMYRSEYNDEEGIVFEAGGELFTVNRLRLVQGSIMFRDMFALATTNDARVKGDGTRDNPVPTGDGAAAFKDFLWAIRVRPPELMVFLKSEGTPEKVIKLANIARLSHKYQDFALADWALQQLHDTLSSARFALDGPALKPLICALALFDDGKDSAIVSVLRQRIDSEAAAKTDALPSLDLIALAEACAASDYTPLLPAAYYALLVSPRTADWIDDPRLSETSKRQLLGGAYRISEEWHKLVSWCPPTVVQRAVHARQSSSRPADLLSKLQAVPPASSFDLHRGTGLVYRDRPRGATLITDEHHAYVIWKTAVDTLIDTFPDKLYEYFGVSRPSAPAV